MDMAEPGLCTVKKGNYTIKYHKRAQQNPLVKAQPMPQAQLRMVQGLRDTHCEIAKGEYVVMRPCFQYRLWDSKRCSVAQHSDRILEDAHVCRYCNLVIVGHWTNRRHKLGWENTGDTWLHHQCKLLMMERLFKRIRNSPEGF
jgi:hypothetical protein